MSEEKDMEIEFWNKWLKAGLSERLELIRNLPILREFSERKKSKKLKEGYATLLNSYFEGLESAIERKYGVNQNEPN